ncbi:MAG: FMN-binding negative transcriptional regulator [Saprospiraceae bacterium]|nr:FMN-binding negative transcriptional regulator [Saprospiraceae bacterium]
MYTPNYFAQKDHQKIFEFIKAYPFATLVSLDNSQEIIATHLPFLIFKEGEHWILKTHMSKFNPQWKELVGQKSLIIFQEPHAYISPSLYTLKRNVPTWNYIAVHMYGTTELIQNKEETMNILKATIQEFEPKFVPKWEVLDEDYKSALEEELVAFELKIERIEATFKLSQNKTIKEQERIAIYLLNEEKSVKRELGTWMLQNKKA